MFLDNAWYQLNLRENLNINNDPVASLDVAILHDLIISPLLGIDDERRDKRINFVGGARGLKELEKRVKNDAYDIAFSLFPTPIESLFKVADADRVMPPKSTWFEPKLLDGLISHVISYSDFSLLNVIATNDDSVFSGLQTLKRILSSPASFLS